MADSDSDVMDRSALVVVANRLPVEYTGDGPDAGWRRSPGGLVSALEPALRGRDAPWIGWGGHLGSDERAAPQCPDEIDEQERAPDTRAAHEPLDVVGVGSFHSAG